MSVQRSSRSNQRSLRTSGIVLSLLAAVLFAHPLYLWPQLGADRSAMLLAGFARPVLSLFGGFLLAYAGLVVYRGRWRPVTPRTAVLFPLTGTVAILGLQWYDQMVHSLGGIHALNNNPPLVAALSLVFLVGGSLARWGKRRAVVGFTLGCLCVFLIGVVVDGTRLPIALVSGAALAVVGAGVGGLGYVLTVPSPDTLGSSVGANEVGS